MGRLLGIGRCSASRILCRLGKAVYICLLLLNLVLEILASRLHLCLGLRLSLRCPATLLDRILAAVLRGQRIQFRLLVIPFQVRCIKTYQQVSCFHYLAHLHITLGNRGINRAVEYLLLIAAYRSCGVIYLSDVFSFRLYRLHLAAFVGLLSRCHGSGDSDDCHNADHRYNGPWRELLLLS